jgi:hypothetical protein
MYYSRLYDHVLSELEFGRTEMGINLLIGMLDVAELQTHRRGQALDELRDHPLHAMLLEDPLCADSRALPEDAVRRVNMLNQPGVCDAVSSTGRRLFAATSETTFARALRQRRREAERKLHRAWRMGQNIWLITDPNCDLIGSLGGVDTSNIQVCSEKALRSLPEQGDCSEPTFDLILAPNLPDLLSNLGLRDAVARLSQQLSAQGVLATSVLMPGHPGTGWRRACFNWEPNCHDGDGLAGLTEAGFTTHSYRDETDCIAWMEIRRA